MEYVIHLLALFIALNFLLKVGFYPRWGMWTVAAGCAFFAWLVTPWMNGEIIALGSKNTLNLYGKSNLAKSGIENSLNIWFRILPVFA